jgi:hypothetical protein
MSMAGFTAEASLWNTSQCHHVVGMVDPVAVGQRVMPQLRPIGIGACMGTCAPDDWQCLFDCLAFERDPFRRFPGRF